MGRRIRWMGAFMILCFGVLLLQLSNIQVVQAHKYATATHNPAVIAAHQNQPRGIIQSADGIVLAQSVPATSGTYKYQRQYPAGPLFAHVVGYLSPIYGATGVESTYNQYLVAHNKPVKTLGDLLTTTTVTDTVTLTMSSVLQQKAVQELAGRAGAIVVLDPTSGAVKAMYSNPTFDPNPLTANSYAVEAATFKAINTKDPATGYAPAISNAYGNIFFPGSSFKTVTTAAAYDRKPLLVNKPQPGYSCIPPGTLGGQTTKPLCNYGGAYCGGTIAVMLPPSCDTGYALLGTDVGGTGMVAEANAFGFNSQPPIDLPHSPFQVSRFLQPACYRNAQIFLAYSSIGQFCTLASPLQMALVAAAFANSGAIMTPHVVQQVRDSQGGLVTTYRPSVWLQATSPATSAAVTKLMQEVVQYGTAAGVFAPQDNVAAKTGTAQVANGTATTDWMIAFAPANHPKVAVAVVIPNQALSATGAEISGPVANAMIHAALALP
jgi:peptidoglycan glycosyltransferase